MAEFPLKDVVLVKSAAPEQPLLSYTVKVTVPAGELPPVSVAVSKNDPPKTTVETDGTVFMTGVTLPTVTTSAVHGLEALALLPSPG
jgi:hypothetical protein